VYGVAEGDGPRLALRRGNLHHQDLLVGRPVGISPEHDGGPAVTADAQLAAVHPDRAVADAQADAGRLHRVEGLPNDLDQLALQRFGVFEIARVAAFLVGRQAGTRVRVNRGQEQLRGLQIEFGQQGTAHDLRRPVVEADQVGRDQDEPPAARLEGQHPCRERIVHSRGQVLTAGVAGHPDRLFGRDVDPGRAHPQTAWNFRIRPGGNHHKDCEGHQADGEERCSHATFSYSRTITSVIVLAPAARLDP